MSYSRTVQPSGKTTAARGRASPRKAPYKYGARTLQGQGNRSPGASSVRQAGLNPSYAGSSVPGHEDRGTSLGQEDAAMGGGARYDGQTTHERVMQSRGSHYVLAPDPSKNSQLKLTASEEMESYDNFKQIKREETARELRSQPARPVGGARLSQRELDEAREKQERKQRMETKFAAVRQREKREEYRRKEKERENEEIEKRLEAQREKAIKLEQRKEAKKKEQLEELRRKRLENLASRGFH